MNSPQAMICSSSSSRISFLFYGVVIICLTSATVSASYGCNETDYHALLSFKSKIIHDPYKVLSTWNHSFHFCDWIGITCGKRHKRVTVLRLYSNGLEGSLSPHVGNLSFLHKLSLVNNSFQGSIPHELGRLSRLRRLYLNDNKFSGVIPINLSGCSNLEELQLDRNKLVGSIPKEMSLLSKLTLLLIDDNKLTGGIPPFLGNITSVEMFSALRNSFGGSIPDTLGHWTSLTEFDCGGCNLYGSIPHSIFNLSLLVYFSLPGNHLTGSLPSEIGNQLPNLEFLQLYRNKLTGVLPPSISNCSKLGYFELSHNNFSGKLTIDFSKLRDINIVRLQNNNFHERGEADDMRFIDSFKNYTRLVKLELHSCNLTGVLPISIGNITSSLGECISLTNLYLSGNIFQGIIPSSFSSLQALEVLDISQNNLSGRIPQFLEKLNSLEFLNLSFNDFEGEVPVVGVFANASLFSVLGNNELCGGLVTLELPKGKGYELLKATDGFSTQNLIGEGGFSSVYKGILDSYERIVFVPSKIYIFQNRGAYKSILAECEALSEYSTPDVATALDYLHNCCETTIVHGDLKPSNILLDIDLVAHVGDFGLARLLGTDLNQNCSSAVKGTIGYAPPEYGIGSEMTTCGDVYSFGILLLEVMTGKKPTHDMFNDGLSLHKFAYMALPDDVVDVIYDDAIVLQSTKANAKKMEECLAAIIKIGVSCSVDSPPERVKLEFCQILLQRILDVYRHACMVKLRVSATRGSACCS
ncbi:kinase-like domain-containing protein [Tanacetum coccineum]|uniref:Kinase-like domain-containing protein n=1 Tax=Tanacetum coccineum TaxID=301880 RepID=A0ABQ4ZJ17_9ASTR